MNLSFGAPLYESFQDVQETEDNVSAPAVDVDVDESDGEEVDEQTTESGEEQTTGSDEELGCPSGYFRGEDTERGFECVRELDEGEASIDEPTEQTTVSGETTTSSGEDGETTSSGVETFVGNNGNNGKVLNLNLFLKSLLFSCLFYLLAHTDTKFAARKAVSSILNLKKARYLYFATAIFFVVYYVLNLLI